MAQNITRFTLVMVFLGIALAIAVFRPPPFSAAQSSASDNPTIITTLPNPEQTPDEGVRLYPATPQDHNELVAWIDEQMNIIQTKQSRLAQEWEEFFAEQNHLTQEWEKFYAEQDRVTQESETLQAEKDHLAQELDALRAEQVQLAQDMETLHTEQAQLTQEWESLQTEQTHLDREWGRLRAKEADLASREQEVQRLWRYSVAALIVSGLMAIPSIVFIVVLMRQGPQPPDKVKEYVRAPRPDQGDPTTLYEIVRSKSQGSNGRSKEAVKQYLRN